MTTQTVPNPNGKPPTTASEPPDQHPLSTDLPVSGLQRARQRRVLDYQHEVLKKKNSLEAVLGTVNAGLMSLSLQLDETLGEALAETPRTIASIQTLLPTMNVYLQVVRQVDRLAQLDLRMSDARKRPTPQSAATSKTSTKPR